jgi:hypothetical protein
MYTAMYTEELHMRTQPSHTLTARHDCLTPEGDWQAGRTLGHRIQI